MSSNIEIGTWKLESSSSGYILLQQDYTILWQDYTKEVPDPPVEIAIEKDTFKINEEGKIVEVYAILHDYEDEVIIEFTDSRK